MDATVSGAHDRSTTLITAGRSASGTSLAPVLHSTSVWESGSFAQANRLATSLRADEFYGRFGNPTVRAFEQAIAELEGAEDALAFGSGMGAVATTVLALCSSGTHIVATRQLYAGTLALLQGPCRRFGIDVTIVDGSEPGAMAAAVQPGRTVLVIAESPSNPVLELVDLDELGSIKGPFTVLDSTFATPLGQRPLSHGIDLVLHSATKGIAGHNDATIGVIAGEKELTDAIWAYSVLHGAATSPTDALNATRGLRTLQVRIDRQSATAGEIAVWLDDQQGVTAVHYPGLPSHPQHQLATRQLDHFGTVVAFELAGGYAAAESLVNNVSLLRRATSLGGPETMICHPATTTNASMTPDEKALNRVTDGLLRVTVGLEHPADIIADLQQALASR